MTGRPGSLRQLAHGAPAVDGNEERPTFTVEHELVDLQRVEQLRPAFERRDDTQDLAPLLQQPVDLDERVAQLDRLRNTSTARGSSSANRNEPASWHIVAKQTSTSRPRSSRSVNDRTAVLTRLGRVAVAVGQVDDTRYRARLEPERTTLARAGEQPEDLG